MDLALNNLQRWIFHIPNQLAYFPCVSLTYKWFMLTVEPTQTLLERNSMLFYQRDQISHMINKP